MGEHQSGWSEAWRDFQSRTTLFESWEIVGWIVFLFFVAVGIYVGFSVNGTPHSSHL